MQTPIVSRRIPSKCKHKNNSDYRLTKKREFGIRIA